MEKGRKVLKTIEVEIPLMLVGAKYNETLHLNVYDDGEIEIFLPMCKENFAKEYLPEDWTANSVCHIQFEKRALPGSNKTYFPCLMSYEQIKDILFDDLIKGC